MKTIEKYSFFKKIFKEVLSWENLSKSLQTLFGVNDQIAQKLKFSVADENDNVNKKDFKRFLEWFSPLAQTDFYQTSSNSISQNGYQLEEIADIVGPR